MNSEFDLLVAFLAAPRRVLIREQLLDLSRLHNDEVYDRSVDVQVGRLRKRIESDTAGSPLIRTERGAGHILTAVVETVRQAARPQPAPVCAKSADSFLLGHITILRCSFDGSKQLFAR